MSGRYIAIEAVDLAGKSTQLGLAAARLRAQGLSVAEVSYPDREQPGTGSWIVRFLDGENSSLAALPHLPAVGPLDALIAQALFAVNRRESAAHLRLLLAEHDVVLASRSDLSGLAYGQALGLTPALLAEVLAALEDDLPHPELYLVLDIDPSSLHTRPRAEGLDAFERDRGLQLRVREAYQRLARERTDVRLIDGSGSQQAVAEQIGQALDEALGG